MMKKYATVGNVTATLVLILQIFAIVMMVSLVTNDEPDSEILIVFGAPVFLAPSFLFLVNILRLEQRNFKGRLTHSQKLQRIISLVGLFSFLGAVAWLIWA